MVSLAERDELRLMCSVILSLDRPGLRDCGRFGAEIDCDHVGARGVGRREGLCRLLDPPGCGRCKVEVAIDSFNHAFPAEGCEPLVNLSTR